MGLALELIARRYERRGPGPSVVVPWLGLGQANAALHDLAGRAIERVEASLGRERRVLGPDPLVDLLPPAWPEPRLSRALWAVLLERYEFRADALEDRLGATAAARLATLGATDPSSLRLLLAERVNSTGPGFVVRSERAAFFEGWATALGLPPASGPTLAEATWLDSEGRGRFGRRGDARPEPHEIVRLLRRRTLEGLLVRADEATLRFPDGSGWRASYRLARARYLYAEPEADCRLRLFGPPRAFADRSIGPRLADLVVRLVAHHRGTGEALVKLNEDRPYRLLLTEAVGKALADDRLEDQGPTFDSQIEERFYRAFVGLGSARRGWEIGREPEPLVSGTHVVIPDFLLTRRETRVYLELLGFWSEEYRRRKLVKLRALAALHPPPRVLLAAETTAEWEELPFPIVRYREFLRPADVIAALQAFDDGSGRIARAIQAGGLGALVEEVRRRGWLAWADVAEGLGLLDPAEARSLISREGAAVPGSMLASGAGLLSAEFVASACRLLETAIAPGSSMPADEIARLMADHCGYGGPLPGLLEALPEFSLRYLSVFEAVVERAGQG